MPFEPVNEDHAVALCEFAVGFDGPLSSQSITDIAAQHDQWRELLPASAVGPADATQAIVPVLQGASRKGVTFATLRADGSHVWALECAFNEVRVSCTRYTRWQRSWEVARQLLKDVVPIISKQQPDRRIGVVALYVVDHFVSPDQDYRVEDVLQRNKWIPDQIFGLGRIWHSNNGWFESHNAGDVLHLLNTRVSRESGQLDLSIVHHLQLRISAGQFVDVNSDAWVDLVSAAMNDLHQSNKRVLGEHLHPDLSRRIRLGGI